MPSQMLELYHFTTAVNAFQIAACGLSPAARQDPMMTLWKPVVWLTEETSNLVDTNYNEWQREKRPSAEWMPMGDLRYGGPVRCTVQLPRFSKKLKRWADFLKTANLCTRNTQTGVILTSRQVLEQIFQPRMPPYLFDQWWLYFGNIPRHRIFVPLTAAIVRESCRYQMDNVMEPEARRQFEDAYNQMTGVAPEARVSIEEEDSQLCFRVVEKIFAE